MKLTYSNIETAVCKVAKAHKMAVTEVVPQTSDNICFVINGDMGVTLITLFDGDVFSNCYVNVYRNVEILDEDTDEPTGEFEYEDYIIECGTDLAKAMKKLRAAQC